MHSNVHSKIIYNSQDMEGNQVSIKRTIINKEDFIHTHTHTQTFLHEASDSPETSDDSSPQTTSLPG